jgi:hypothetical protein
VIGKDDFTPEEWQQLVNAPRMASMYITLASPSGPIGVVKEMLSFPKLVLEAVNTAGDDPLVDAVAADFKQQVEKREMAGPELSKDYEMLKGQCLDACRDVASLLADRPASEAEGFKHWVYQAALNTAGAAKEGGFLGIGGVRVSQAEVAALSDIATALAIEV